jgi:hypothetical protein
MTLASASRVTRSSRSLRLAMLLFAGALSVVTALRAQEPTPAAAGKPATPASASGADAPDAAREAATDGVPPGTAAAPAPKGSSPSRFEPTEKVRADFDVSFPIDI